MKFQVVVDWEGHIYAQGFDWGDRCPDCGERFPVLHGPHPTWIACGLFRGMERPQPSGGTGAQDE